MTSTGRPLTIHLLLFMLALINKTMLSTKKSSIMSVHTSSTAAFAEAMAVDGIARREQRQQKKMTALVTGSTDGIGLTTAKNLANKGYTVLIHGRDQSRISKAVEHVKKFCNDQQNKINNDDNIDVIPLPPTDISTIKGCYELVDHVRNAVSGSNGLSILMNNAGVYSKDLETTQDGLEMTFAVNVLAPFIITSKLLPELLSASRAIKKSSRIVIASSISQSWSPIKDWNDIHLYQSSRTPYSAHRSYSESKLLDAMLTMEFHDQLQQFQDTQPTKAKDTNHTPITCTCLDPGTVNTKMLLAGWGLIGIDVRDALDETWLCSNPDVEGLSGKYFVGQCEQRASSPAYDAQQRSELWNLLTKLAPDAAMMWSKDNINALRSETRVEEKL